jgi:hypothetical protein
LGGALHMSAFGRKADIAITLSASVMCLAPFGVNRTIYLHIGGLDLRRVE